MQTEDKITQPTPTTKLSAWASDRYTPSKRHIGLLCILIGVLGFIVLVSLDQITGNTVGGYGPSQRVGIGTMIGLVLLGLTLLPLGDDPL